MKKAFEVKTITGTQLNITIENRSVMIGVCGECDPEKRKHNITSISTKINGETVYLKVSRIPNSGATKERCEEAGVKWFFNFSNEKGRCCIIITADDAAQIAEFLNSDADADECIKEIIVGSNNSNYIVAEAKEIIEKSKNTVRNADGTLMTVSQAEKYINNYNNTYNEGAEGYVPEIITYEEFNWAREVIDQYKVQSKMANNMSKIDNIKKVIIPLWEKATKEIEIGEDGKINITESTHLRKEGNIIIWSLIYKHKTLEFESFAEAEKFLTERGYQKSRVQYKCVEYTNPIIQQHYMI